MKRKIAWVVLFPILLIILLVVLFIDILVGLYWITIGNMISLSSTTIAWLRGDEWKFEWCLDLYGLFTRTFLESFKNKK